MSYQYDNKGNLTQKVLDLVAENASQPTSSAFVFNTRYNAFGEVIKDEQGVYVYNALGQLWMTTKGDGVLKTHEYDNAGRLIKTTHALNGETHIKRDALGYAEEIKQPKYTQHGVESIPKLVQKHDRWGNIVEHKDAMGYVTKAQYNHQNKVIREILPPVAVTNASGVTQTVVPQNIYQYDATGNLVAKINANEAQQTFSFDANGNQVAQKDGEGSCYALLL